MPIFTQYKCDGCGAEKREANKWWALRVDGGILLLQPFADAERRGMGHETEILCGQECVAKKVGQFMDQRNALSARLDGKNH